MDDAVDMLEELPAIVVKRVLQNATPETRDLINQFLQYPENSAGSIMTAEYIGLKRNMTVEQAFAYIRENGVDKETIYTCFVTDSKRCLQGVVTVKDLLMSPYNTIIKDIMDENVIYAVTTEDREDVVEPSINTTCFVCRWWTMRTAWWELSRWMTRWRSWSRRPRRILKRWPPCFPLRSPI